MTFQAILALRISAGLHVASVLAALAYSAAWYQPPHFHLHHGTITIEASFAAVEEHQQEATTVFLPMTATEVAPQPSNSSIEAADLAPLTKLTTEHVVHAELPPLPTELDECECDAPEHLVHTPLRSPQEVAKPITAAEPPKSSSPKQATSTVAIETKADVPSLTPVAAATAGTQEDQPATKLPSNPKPPYPADAYAAGLQGRVVLEVHVNAEGTVDSLRVKTSSGLPAFDQSALDTVTNWRFTPALRGGRHVPAVLSVPIRFAIR